MKKITRKISNALLLFLSRKLCEDSSKNLIQKSAPKPNKYHYNTINSTHQNSIYSQQNLIKELNKTTRKYFFS